MLSDVALYIILIDILSNIKSGLALLLIPIGILLIMLSVVILDEDSDLSYRFKEPASKLFKKLVISLTIIIPLLIIIPSSNSMYSALTLVTIDKAIVKDKNMQVLLNKSFELLNLKLDEILEDQRKNNKGN